MRPGRVYIQTADKQYLQATFQSVEDGSHYWLLSYGEANGYGTPFNPNDLSFQFQIIQGTGNDLFYIHSLRANLRFAVSPDSYLWGQPQASEFSVKNFGDGTVGFCSLPSEKYKPNCYWNWFILPNEVTVLTPNGLEDQSACKFILTYIP